ncbi:mitochondrial acyl carrier protein [Branchiostoma belcheri]|nr:mitochondrial acyl carrier protein [Branchiostoma belcheri]
MVGRSALLVAVLVLEGLLITTGETKDERSLVQASVLFRHGDRSPTYTFPTDVHQEDAWEQGFGFLSSLYVRSTDTDRTLMSVEANLDRLYPDQPVPVHTVRTGLDPVPPTIMATMTSPTKALFQTGSLDTVPNLVVPRLLWLERVLRGLHEVTMLLRAFFLNCPRYSELLEEELQSEEFVQKEKENKEFMEFVVEKAGWGEPHGIMDAWRTQDPLLCEKAHDMSWPDWVTPEVYERLTELTAYASEINFRGDEMGRLMAGLLVNHIVSNMTTAQQEIKENKEPYRLIMYSAHDIDVSALLSALDVYNGLSPPYASCVMVELYRDSLGHFSVQILYRNDSSHEPYVLTIPGCEKFCPFDDFVHLNDEVILDPGKWRRACELPPITWLSGFLYGVFVASTVLSAVLYLMPHRGKPASSGDKKAQ